MLCFGTAAMGFGARVAHPHPLGDPLQQGLHAIQAGFDRGQARGRGHGLGLCLRSHWAERLVQDSESNLRR